MKKNFLSVALLSSALFFAACGEKPESDQAEVGEAVEVEETEGGEEEEASMEMATFSVVPESSQIIWKGYKRFTDSEHKGMIQVSEGELKVSEGNITGGKFTINMNSIEIKDEDLPEDKKADLKGHLMNSDFFNVKKYKAAEFQITNVSPYTASEGSEETKEVAKGKSVWKTENPTHKITGNLTIMDSTRSISFPAKVSIEEGMVKATARFGIDRSWWGVSYGTDADVRDKVISKDVNVEVNLEAKK